MYLLCILFAVLFVLIIITIVLLINRKNKNNMVSKENDEIEIVREMSKVQNMPEIKYKKSRMDMIDNDMNISESCDQILRKSNTIKSKANSSVYRDLNDEYKSNMAIEKENLL